MFTVQRIKEKLIRIKVNFRSYFFITHMSYTCVNIYIYIIIIMTQMKIIIKAERLYSHFFTRKKQPLRAIPKENNNATR